MQQQRAQLLLRRASAGIPPPKCQLTAVGSGLRPPPVLWRQHRSSRGASSSSAASLSAAASGPGGSLEQLAELATADVIESQGLIGGIDPHIAPLWRPISLCGPAFTVRSVGGDNLAVHRALAEAPTGSVLVVESHGTAEEIHARALIGDIIGYAALRRGLAGLVTNAPVRDGRRLQSLSFPVYCCGRQIKGPTKSDAGELGGTVTVGGTHDGSNLDSTRMNYSYTSNAEKVTRGGFVRARAHPFAGVAIAPGDFICGDDDGLVAVPQATIAVSDRTDQPSQIFTTV